MASAAESGGKRGLITSFSSSFRGSISIPSCPHHHHTQSPLPSVFSRLAPRSAASVWMVADSEPTHQADHTREPPKGCITAPTHTHSRTRPPAECGRLPACPRCVEGLHTTSKSCGPHLQIETNRIPSDHNMDPSSSTPRNKPFSGTWVDGG